MEHRHERFSHLDLASSSPWIVRCAVFSLSTFASPNLTLNMIPLPRDCLLCSPFAHVCFIGSVVPLAGFPSSSMPVRLASPRRGLAVPATSTSRGTPVRPRAPRSVCTNLTCPRVSVLMCRPPTGADFLLLTSSFVFARALSLSSSRYRPTEVRRFAPAPLVVSAPT